MRREETAKRLPILLRRFEAIADAAQRLQILRMARVSLDFFPQTPHVDVDRARCYEGSLFPYGVEQLVAREYAPAVGSQILEKAKFPHGSENRPALHLHRHRGSVDFKIAQAKHFRSYRGLAQAAQHAAHAGYQFARAEWFRDVVVSTHFEAFHSVCLARLGGQENDGGRGETGR